MKPKLWDGPTPIGEALTRALNNLPSRVGTSYGVETLDNGQLGTTRSKMCYGYNEVYRSDVTSEPTYFLCTWQQTVVYLLGRTNYKKDVRFINIPTRSFVHTAFWATVKPGGNCAYVGDGLVAGITGVWDDSVWERNFSISLMRTPAVGRIISAEEYLATADSRGPKELYSFMIALDVDAPAEGEEGRAGFFNPLIVPLGWKNEAERYIFAVADFTYPFQGSTCASLWIVSTGTLKAQRVPLAGVNTHGTNGGFCLTCTAPGRMEFLGELYHGPLRIFSSDDYGQSWESQPIDDGWEYSSANNEISNGGRRTGALLVAAGNTTFLATQARTAGVNTWDARYAVVLLARSSSGAFARMEWPGDTFVNDPRVGTFPNAVAVEYTSQGLATPDKALEWDSTPVAWMSTGEGCAAFFFLPYTFKSTAVRHVASDNEPVTVVATVDGGSTWNTRVIENSLNMSQLCLLTGNSQEPCAFLFAVIDPETYLTQLYRMSADLQSLTKYGPPYPDPWRRGLINFKDYVHPGFPGVYDGPEHQPRKPA